jgi:hypothetical protein
MAGARKSWTRFPEYSGRDRYISLSDQQRVCKKS